MENRMVKTSWFDNFLNSFEAGKYYGLAFHVKAWQYKNFMCLAASNGWKTISLKQVNVFERNIAMEMNNQYYFGVYENSNIKVFVTIGRISGTAEIEITKKG